MCRISGQSLIPSGRVPMMNKIRFTRNYSVAECTRWLKQGSDFERVHHRQVGEAVGELKRKLAAGDGHRESFVDGPIGAAGLREDIEIGEHLRSIDKYVKGALSRSP